MDFMEGRGLDRNQLITSQEWMTKWENPNMDIQYPGIQAIFRTLLVDTIFPENEFPFAAAVIRVSTQGQGGIEVISAHYNETNTRRNSLAHAETVAIEDAIIKLGTKHLTNDCVLLSNVEPCAMCAGALIHSGCRTLVYSAYQSDIRGNKALVDGVWKPFRTEPHSYSAEQFLKERDSGIVVVGGYMRSEVMSSIFRTTKKQNSLPN